MKNKFALSLLSLFAVCSMLLTACGTRLNTEDPEPKRPNETNIAPEDTISKEDLTLSFYEPVPEATEPGSDPWGVAPPEPTDAPIVIPGEGGYSQPGLISVSGFQAVRAQGLSVDKMKLLISKYLPAPGSESTLSWVHITNRDSLERFMQEVDSNVFREACAPYDGDFFTEYDLIVIPRMTNTGSMEHSAELIREDGKLRVSVSVTEPEVSTTVMTNWLLVVPAAKADTQGVTITVGMDIAADLPMPTVGIGKLG